MICEDIYEQHELLGSILNSSENIKCKYLHYNLFSVTGRRRFTAPHNVIDDKIANFSYQPEENLIRMALAFINLFALIALAQQFVVKNTYRLSLLVI